MQVILQSAHFKEHMPECVHGEKIEVNGFPSQPRLMWATQCEDLNIFHKSSFKDTLHTQTYHEIEDKYKPTALMKMHTASTSEKKTV